MGVARQRNFLPFHICLFVPVALPSLDSQIIPSSWLSRPAIQVAPDLIGCTLVRQMPDGNILRGMIVETEAYEPGDPACHAYRRRTDRNSVMFGPAGMTYVYLIYGIYFCLNVVTAPDGVPSAVLLRALQLEVIPPWINLSKEPKIHRVAAGPGKLCRALKIDQSLTAQPLLPGYPLWLEHRTLEFQQRLHPDPSSKAEKPGSNFLVQTTRIGLTQGTDLPWRWYLKDCPAVSKR